ncbi:hypothetical protein BKA60DRAFT_612749 [Fusarium oxysporum]|nr:hypothetical protein BKA60DRAFT_612749 [Fusarium oxysporum]
MRGNTLSISLPGGDTLFILRNSGATFATCNFEDEWPNALPEHQTEISKRRESSMITRKSHKIEPEPGYKWTLTASDWDGEAFLLLMNILHHKTREVPRIIELEKLAKVAVLVDYYGCHEAVELWAETWISNLHSDMTESFYSRELLLKLTISWVFSDRQKFRSLTEVAIRTSRGPIPTLGLPIPNQIAGYGLKPLPSHPYHGFSLDALKQAINKFNISMICTYKGRNHL